MYCTVTAANGKSMIGVRHVFVYDRDAHQPTTVFQLAQCFGLNLANTFPRHVKLLPNLFKSMIRIYTNAKAHPKNTLFPWRQ